MTTLELLQLLEARAQRCDQGVVENRDKSKKQKHRCQWAWGWHDALSHRDFLEAKWLRELAQALRDRSPLPRAEDQEQPIRSCAEEIQAMSNYTQGIVQISMRQVAKRLQALLPSSPDEPHNHPR